MKKSTKIFILIIIVLALIFSGLYILLGHKKTSVISANKCPYFENYVKTETEHTYINTTIGFSIQVPKGWYIPTANDADPRMYNCNNVEGGPSLGIYTTNALKYYDYKTELSTTKEKMYRNLIPGAIVIKTNTDNFETAPWGYPYTIVYEKEKKAFFLIVRGNIEESTLLPTLKLI